jgi:Tfp pilus assembly protein PilF
MNSRRFFCVVLLFLFLLMFSCATKSPEQVPFAKERAAKEQALALKTDTLSPNRLALAQNLVDEHFYEVALVQLQQAIKEKDGDARVYDLAGVCARELGDHKASETYLKKARSIAPDNASVHNNLGILYAVMNEKEKAMQNLRQAVILDPGRPDFMNNQGFFLMEQNQYSDAEKAFKRALGLDPNFTPAMNNLIICLGLQYKDNQAMDLLLSRQDEKTAWHNMASIYFMRNQPEKAKKLMEFVRTQQKETKESAFDIQAKNGENLSGKGISGDVADLIYSKKYQAAMESDPKDFSQDDDK